MPQNIRTAIKALCKIKRVKSVWGDGRVEYNQECSSCHGAHEDHCVTRLLSKRSDQKIAYEVVRKGYVLDYDGGGRSSCSICHGSTEWQGNSAKHSRACPYPIAVKILPKKLVDKAVENFI